ncbi:SUMF1/EgtB/PvdO family nonheme iron enzyme [Rheinheimera sp. F8]|uniref:SUMF1/EgtB/PvdO family nonheme iron enzyme n=1 Tax=Rheinheimera sp. F8 TaxID=1763998 RepID=UPI0007449312|nr:SUMF1/EgtB/PvdO family nonheme iron enzyme [Rheinheimera sp. F8]ALZ76746.1 hypothetical protein ATY27_13890 [Rheinheimera sp. F8]
MQAAQIGKYQIERKLGVGGFGEVFLARDPKLDVQVAIKVFRIKDDEAARQATSASGDAGQILRQRFLDEARILHQLSSNPYIVNIRDFDEMPDGTPYYVMNYLPRSLVDEIGKDVFSRAGAAELPAALQPRPLPLPRALAILQQVLLGLTAVHQAGLVHRDIKPANILFDDSGKVQLTDFGIAKLPDTEHSQSGLGMGSRNYMSPEQRESAKHVSAASDVYSVGVLAYRMLTGALPIGRFDDPIRFVPALAPAINQLILAAISSDEHQRPANAGDMLSRLQQAMAMQADATTEQTGTFVQGTGATLKSELKPLQQKIAELLKTEGVVDGAQLKALSVAADIAGVSETDLTQLIAETKTAQPAAVQSFIKWREKVEAAKAQHQGSIPHDEREALLAGGALLGKTEAELARFLPATTSGNTTASAQKSSQTTSNHAEAKKPTKNLLAAGIATILLAGGGYYGYSSYQQLDVERNKDLSAWQQAKLADTVDAYQQYLNQVPEGQYRQGATKALEQLKEAQLASEKLAKTQQEQKLAAEQSATEQAQQWLIKLGYEITANGELDARTKAAIEQFEASEKMLVTGVVDATLLAKLEQVYWRNDQQAFEKAKATHTEQSYQQYLDARVDGRFRTQATQGSETVKQQLKDKAIADATEKAETEDEVRQQAIADAKAEAKEKEQRRLAVIAAERKAALVQAQAVKPYVGNIVYIPAGNFMMGCSEGDSECDSDEFPRHQVSMKAFKLMETEVTFAMWDACVQAGGCSHKPDDRISAISGRGNKPVINVSFDHIIQQFIPWLNKTTGQRFRLPSEAEWEYAARGGTTTKYSWGDSIHCGQARYGRRENGGECSSSYDGTVPVKFFAANGYGLYVMSGNVLEWTQDCWNESYTGAPTNGSAWQQGDCAKRVGRGGSWFYGPASLRVSNRNRDDSSGRYSLIGFRLAQDL